MFILQRAQNKNYKLIVVRAHHLIKRRKKPIKKRRNILKKRKK